MQHDVLQPSVVRFLFLVDSIQLTLEQTQHEPHILVVDMEFFDDDGGVLIDAAGVNSDSPNDPFSSAL